MANHTQVANAFAHCREAKSRNLRTENIGGATFAISYRTPVAATDGRVTLKTIERYSSTTSSQMSCLQTNGPVLPTTEQMLRAIMNGSVTFDEAAKLGHHALDNARKRISAAQGAAVDKIDAGAYRVTGSGHVIEKRKDGWAIVHLSARGAGTSAPYPTLKAARVAALDLDDVPRPHVNHWMVERKDFSS